jgi:hypothetical protein
MGQKITMIPEKKCRELSCLMKKSVKICEDKLTFMVPAVRTELSDEKTCENIEYKLTFMVPAVSTR